MGLGDAWTEGTSGSVAKLNLVTIPSGTGDYINSLDKTKHKVAYVTADGSGLLANHLYVSDGSTWLDIQTIQDHFHSHSGDGGDFTEIVIGMTEQINYHNPYHLRKADWTETVSGTGSTSEVTNDATWSNNAILKLVTGATSGSGATLQIGAVRHDFGDHSGFNMILRMTQTTDIASHWGFGMETVTAADDNVRKHGVVQCTATNGNWFGRTATGSAHSDSDTGVAVSTSETFIKSQVFPLAGTPNQIVAVAGTLALTKTTDIPVDGSGSRTNHFKISLKNNAAVTKDCYLIKLKEAYWSNGWWG